MITEFSPEVAAELKTYVYRLIDPRNGQTFYVGKGKGNRVFQHMKCAIDYYDEVSKISDTDPQKFRIIKEIHEAGLDVIHIIHRWNLTDDEALEVEAALIDCYSGLANIQSGHGAEYGVTNAEMLETRFNCKIYEEPDDFKYIIIKVQNQHLNELFYKFPQAYRYEATRHAWKPKPKSISEYPYAFSVTDGIVKEVYEIEKWNNLDSLNRYEFEGRMAPDCIRDRFIGKRIPEIYRKKGMASPLLFSKNRT